MAEILVKLPRNIIAEIKFGSVNFIYLNDFSFMYKHIRDNKELLKLYIYDSKLQAIVGSIDVLHILRSRYSDEMWLYTGKLSPFRKDEYESIFIDPEEEAFLCIFKNACIFNKPLFIKKYMKGIRKCKNGMITTKLYEEPKYYEILGYGVKRKYKNPKFKMNKLQSDIKNILKKCYIIDPET